MPQKEPNDQDLLEVFNDILHETAKMRSELTQAASDHRSVLKDIRLLLIILPFVWIGVGLLVVFLLISFGLTSR